MDKLDLYTNCMEEIKKRTEVITEHLNGGYNEKYLITETEFLCVQLRKVLENIALASLVANKEKYSSVRKNFASDWNAKRILNDLEEANPNFYPKPTEQIRKPDGTFSMVDITKGFLTKDQFVHLYNKCGELLHADNPYGNKKNFEIFYSQIGNWLKKIITLLNHHVITLSDETIIIALMQSDEDGKPHTTLFKEKNAFERDGY